MQTPRLKQVSVLGVSGSSNIKEVIQMRKPREEQDKVQLSVYFPVEWKKMLFELADEDSRTFNSLMVSITKDFLEKKGLMNEER
jgi:hypothetical protein